MAMENPNGEFIITTFDHERRRGFNVLPDRGVKVWHIPTGLVAESDIESSAHRNKALAMQKMMQMLKDYAENEVFVATVLTVKGMKLFVFNNEGELSFVPCEFKTAMEAAAAAIKTRQIMGKEFVSFTIESKKM